MDLQANPQRYKQALHYRHHPTNAERDVWELLRRKHFGYRFHRQKVIGNYIVDFWCPALRLVLEVDGPGHMFPSARIHDKERDEALLRMGIDRIVRLPSGLAIPALIAHIEKATDLRFGHTTAQELAEDEYRRICQKHPGAGLTNWGTCWTCYSEKHRGERA